MTDYEYKSYIEEYLPKIKSNIDIILSTYTDSITSLKRDYTANLALEKRTFLNTKNIDEYNKSLANMKELAKEENINFYLFDTTNKSEREVSFEVTDILLNDMRKKYIKRLNKKFK